MDYEEFGAFFAWWFGNKRPWGQRNPLSVLGFDVESVRVLRDHGEVLEKAVRMMARLKLLIHHPDRSGNGKLARDVNLAVEFLNNNPAWRDVAVLDFLQRGDDAERQLSRARETIDELKSLVQKMEAERRARGGSRSAIAERDLDALERRLRAAGGPGDQELAVRAEGMYACVYLRRPIRAGDVPVCRLRYLGTGDRWEPVLDGTTPEQVLALVRQRMGKTNT